MNKTLVEDHQSRSFARRNPLALLLAFYSLSPPANFVFGLPEWPPASAHATESRDRLVRDFADCVCSVLRTALHSDCALAPRLWGPHEPFTLVTHLCAHELSALHSSTAARRALPRARRGRAAQRGRHGVGPRRRAGGAEPVRAPRARPTMPRGRRSQILGVRPSTFRLPAHAVASTSVIVDAEKARNTPSEATRAVPRHAQRCTAPSRRRSIRQWCGKHLH